MPSSASRIHRFLHFLERYTKTDMVYLASGSFWLSIGTFMASVSSFLLAIAFANLVAPETFGSYKYVLSVAGVLAISVLPGIDTALQRAVARGHEGSLMPTFRAKLRWGSLGSLAALGIAAYYFLHADPTLALAFVLVSLFLPFVDTFTVYDDLLRGRQAFARSAVLSAVAQVVTTVALVLAIYLHPTLVWMLGVYLLSWTLVRGLLLIYVLRTDPPNDVRDEAAVAYGKHLSVMKASSIVAGSLGSILLFQTIGGTALAVFTLALAPIEQVRGWLASIETLLLPKLSGDSWKLTSTRNLLRRTWPFFAMLALGVIVYILLAPLFFSLLFPKYAVAVPYSQAYAPTLLITAFNIVLTAVLRAKSQVRMLYVASAVSLGATVIFTIPLAYVWGIAGLISAIYIAKILECAAMVYLIGRAPSINAEVTES